MKFFGYIVISLMIVLLGSATVLAQGTTTSDGVIQVNTLTNTDITEGVTDAANLPDFLNNIYRYGVGIAAILAVIMITIGGFKYMTSEIPGMRLQNRGDILRAIFGLLLVLAPFIVFSIINPDILELDAGLEELRTESHGLPGESPGDDDEFMAGCRTFSGGPNTIDVDDEFEVGCCTQQRTPSCVVETSEEDGGICLCEDRDLEFAWRGSPTITGLLESGDPLTNEVLENEGFNLEIFLGPYNSEGVCNNNALTKGVITGAFGQQVIRENPEFAEFLREEVADYEVDVPEDATCSEFDPGVEGNNI